MTHLSQVFQEDLSLLETEMEPEIASLLDQKTSPCGLGYVYSLPMAGKSRRFTFPLARVIRSCYNPFVTVPLDLLVPFC